MKILRLIAAGLLIPLALPDTTQLEAQEEITSENTMDLWSRWRNGFEKFEAAENAAEMRNFPEALKLYTASRDAFESVRTLNPNWQKSVINYRIDLCTRKIEALKQYSGKNGEALKKTLPKVDKQAMSAGQIARQKAQLEAAGEEIASLQKKLRENAKAAARIDELTKERDTLLKKQASLQVQLKDVQKSLAEKKTDSASEKLALAEKKRADELSKKLAEVEKLRKQEQKLLEEARSARTKAEDALRQTNDKLTKATASSLRSAELELDNPKLSADNASLKKEHEKTLKTSEKLERELAVLQKKILELEKLQKDAAAKTVPSGKVKSLEARIAKLTEEKETLSKTAAFSSAEIGNLQKKILALNQEKAAISETKASSEKEILKLQKTIATLRSEREKLVKESASHEENVKKLQKDLATLKKEAETLKNNRQPSAEDALRKEIASLREANQKLERRSMLSRETEIINTELKKQLADAQKQIKAFGKGNSSSLAKQNSDLALALRKEQEKTATLEKSIRLSASFSANRKRRENELRRSLDESKKQIAALQASLAQEKEKMKDFIQANALLEKRAEEADALKQENSSTRLDLDHAQNMMNEVVQKLSSSDAQQKALKEASKRIGKLEKDLAKAEKELKQRSAKAQTLAQAEKEIASLRKALSAKGTKESAAETEQLRKQIAALSDRLQVKEKELKQTKKTPAKTNTKASEEKKTLEALVRKYEKEIAILRREAAAATKDSKASAAEMEQLKKQIARLSNMLQLKEKDLKQALADLKKEDSVSKALSRAEQELSSLRASKSKDSKTSAAEMKQMKKQIARLSDTLQLKEKELAQLKKTPAKTNTNTKEAEEKKALEALVRQYEKEISSLRKQLEKIRINAPDKALHAEIAAQTAAVSELKESKTQYESALKSMTSKNSTLQKKISELEIALSNSRIETDAARKMLQKGLPQGELERKNNELQDSSTKLKAIHQHTLTQLAEEREKNKKLSADLEEARRIGDASALTASRLSTSLKAWQSGQGPSQELKAKEEALTLAIKECAEAKEEIRNRNLELTMANEQIKNAHKMIRSLKKKLSAANELNKDLKMINPQKALEVENRHKKIAQDQIPPLPKELAKDNRKNPEIKKVPEVKKTADKTADKKNAAKKDAVKKDAVKKDAVKKNAAKKSPETKKQSSERSRKKYAEAMKMAAEAEKSGNTADALVNYWRAAELANTAEAYAGISRSYLARKEKKSAVSAYRRAVELGLPRDSDYEKKLNQE